MCPNNIRVKKMNKLVIINIVLIILIIFLINKKQKELLIEDAVIPNIPQEKEDLEENKEEERKTPEFKKYPPLRTVENLGKVLSDIESHMPAGHIYKDSDKITWGHETTHGINSQLRMKSSKTSYQGNTTYIGQMIESVHGKPVFKSFNRINCFYVLNDQYVVIQEPNTTIQEVAKNIPKSLRGGVYQLYLVQQAQSWNDTPLYVFDEWVAYTNGSEVRLDLKIKERSESVLFMLEFNVYALCVAMTSKTNDEQLLNYLQWNIERAMNIYQKSKQELGNSEDHDKYLNQMRNNADAQSLREYTRETFGSDWCKEILGF